MLILFTSAQSVYFNKLFCGMCIRTFSDFWTIPNHTLKKTLYGSGSPMWCPRAPGRPQISSRPPAGIDVVREAKGVMAPKFLTNFSISFCALRVVVPNKNCCSSKSIYLTPINFGLATLLPADLF